MPSHGNAGNPLRLGFLRVGREWSLRWPAPELADRYRAEGCGPSTRWVSCSPTAWPPAPTARCGSGPTQRPFHGTFADGLEMAQRVAGALRARGVGPGDVVAFQLPNHIEAAATFWGVALLGAPVVPIVHFYGPKEVAYILRQSEARVLVTADRFGHLDYLEMLEACGPTCPHLEHVLVVGDDAGRAVTASTDAVSTRSGRLGRRRWIRTRPRSIAYTSGTTADPKGVIHTHRTHRRRDPPARRHAARRRLPLLIGRAGRATPSACSAGLLLPV